MNLPPDAPVTYPRLVIVRDRTYACYLCTAVSDLRVESAPDDTYACCWVCATKVLGMDIAEGQLLPTVEEPSHLMRSRIEKLLADFADKIGELNESPMVSSILDAVASEQVEDYLHRVFSSVSMSMPDRRLFIDVT